VSESALLILHADARFRGQVKDLLQDRVDVFETGNATEAQLLIEQYDVGLVVTDRLFPDSGAPLILIGSVQPEQLAEGINRKVIAQYIPHPKTAGEVVEAVLRTWDQQSPCVLDAFDHVSADDLVSVFAHDVSNLAAALAGVFELMVAGQLTPDCEEYPEFVSMGYHCSKDLLDAIGFVVDLHRMQTGKRTPMVCSFQIDDLLSFALERVAERARDRDIILTHESNLEKTVGDLVLLRKAVMALLMHAIRMTPKEGTVRLQVNLQSESDVPLLVVRVSDEDDPLFPGVGKQPLASLLPMPAHAANSPRGITLDDIGMAFCVWTARLHDGQAWIVSHEPVGNTFAFAIPMRDRVLGKDMDC